MNPTLSILIPCFNCEKTLEEAVASCYRQSLDLFQIVLVDDGSTDGTRAVMERIAAGHPEVTVVFHEYNKGGGAARNTAASHAKGDVLFCLDSDDVLGDGTLSLMRDFLKEKGADAVGIHRSIKFRGTDLSAIEVEHTFVRPGDRIVLNDLLEHDGLCALYSTFMVTKEAFTRAGGYPTRHGFDTQGFAWRFLASGGIAYTCPEARYYHRVNFTQSYYLREAHAGRINYNWFDILDEQFHLFSPETQRLILSFDYAAIGQNLFDAIRAHEKTLGANGGKEQYRKHIDAQQPEARSAEEWYWLGSVLLKEGAYDRAGVALERSQALHRSSRTAEKLAIRAALSAGDTIDQVWEMLARTRTRIPRNDIRNVAYRAVRKIRKIASENERVRGWLLSLHFARQDITARLHAKHSFALILSWIGLQIEKQFRYRFPSDCIGANGTIDIVIPTIAKDQVLLKTYLSYLRKNLCGTIGTMYIVAPDDAALREFCDAEGIVFVEETSVLGYGKEMMQYVVAGKNRDGWLFQQLLKLSGDRIVMAERYVIVDSDTLLLRPHAFMRGGSYIFFENNEWQEPYFRAFERLFGYKAPTRRSLTAHMMIFDVSRLREMKQEIESRSGMPWDKAYIRAADRTSPSGISDYDTYANWLMHAHPELVRTQPFYNHSISRKKLEQLPELAARYAKRYASLSLHSYNA